LLALGSGAALVLVLTNLAGINTIPSAPRAAAAQQPGTSDKWGLVEVKVDERDFKNFGTDKRSYQAGKTTRDGYETSELRYDGAGKLEFNFRQSWTFSRPPGELTEGQVLNLVVQGTAEVVENRFLSGYAAVGGSGVDVKVLTVSMDGKQYPNKEFPNWNMPAVGRLDWGNFGDRKFKNAIGEYQVSVPKATPTKPVPRELKVSFYNGNPNIARPMVTYRYERGAKPIESGGPTPVGPTPVGPTPDGRPPTFGGVWEDWGANVGAGRGTPPAGTGGTWGQ